MKTFHGSNSYRSFSKFWQVKKYGGGHVLHVTGYFKKSLKFRHVFVLTFRWPVAGAPNVEYSCMNVRWCSLFWTLKCSNVRQYLNVRNLRGSLIFDISNIRMFCTVFHKSLFVCSIVRGTWTNFHWTKIWVGRSFKKKCRKHELIIVQYNKS